MKRVEELTLKEIRERSGGQRDTKVCDQRVHPRQTDEQVESWFDGGKEKSAAWTTCHLDVYYMAYAQFCNARVEWFLWWSRNRYEFM